jgi:hypothetical protein
LCNDRHVLFIRTGRAQLDAFDASMRAVFSLDLAHATYRDFAGEEFAEGVTLTAGESGGVPLPPRY